MTDFFIAGFIKRAAEYNISEEQAIDILKQAMAPAPMMPSNNGMSNPSMKMPPTSMSASAPVTPTPAAAPATPMAPKLSK